MVKMWRDLEREVKAKGSIMESGLAGIEAVEGAVPNGWENSPFSEVRKQPASKFVISEQRWCARFIAESYSRVRIDKENTKTYFKLVENAINANYKGPFDVNDLLSWMDLINKSDGTLQRKALSWLVCLGILKMNHIKVQDKNGKDKIKYVFVKETKIIPCPNLTIGKCSFDWKKGAITDYFPQEYKEIPESDGELD